MKKIIVAIDGYSSTGKSTVAKQLARRLGYIYVDTGAMYRSVTLYGIQNGLITANHFDKKKLVQHLKNIHITFVPNSNLGFSETYLNGENVEQIIRSLEISSYVSKVAAIPEVRSVLVKQQQQLGKDKGVVMDGRDIGTVVFPEAELKLFMTASAHKRAKRRYEELIERGDNVTFNAVLENVKERDYIDSHREDSPLRKAEQAIEIDNSDMTLEEQFQKILQLIKKKVVVL